MTDSTSPNRPLTTNERSLVEWMLRHGKPEAAPFLAQLESAQVTPERCPCGCASIYLVVEGHPSPSGGMRPVADFVFGNDADLSGIFVYEQGGVLAGVEVYGLAGDAPSMLPRPESLRPFETPLD